MRERKMGRVIIQVCIVVIILTLLCSTAGFAGEKKKLEWKEVGYALKIELIDVPDYKGHITGTYQRRGLCLFENGDVASYKQMGTMDADSTGGDHWGYYELTFEDGSSFIYKIQGTETTKTGELPRFGGTGKFIKGTGRFKDIKGTVKYGGRYYTGLDDDNKAGAVLNVTAEYELPDNSK